MLFKKFVSAAVSLSIASVASLALVACSSDDSSTPVVPTDSTSTDTTTGTTQSYGILPTTADASIAQSLYTTWKSTYFKTYTEEAEKYPTAAQDWTYVFGDFISAGLIPGRVVWDTSSDSYCVIDESTDSYKKRGCTVSEGVGYGMLLALFQGDYEVLNALWYYNRGYRAYQATTDLMPWRTGLYSYESLGSQANSASATDADLDIATALILAYYNTGIADYLNDALLIIYDLWDEEISPTYMIYSGNTATWKQSTSAYNLSYFSPIAIKLFALVDPNHDWTSVLNTMYTFMQNVQAAGTGVFPDWVDANGNAINPDNGSADETYWMFHQESIRIPWRIAWDYFWTQDSRALSVLTTLNNFISEKSDGDPANLETTGKVMYSAVVGMEDGSVNSLQSHWYGAWCLTGMAGNQTWLDACTSGFNTRTMSGFSYYPHILMTMFSELLNGYFAKPAALSL